MRDLISKYQYLGYLASGIKLGKLHNSRQYLDDTARWYLDDIAR